MTRVIVRCPLEQFNLVLISPTKFKKLLRAAVFVLDGFESLVGIEPIFAVSEISERVGEKPIIGCDLQPLLGAAWLGRRRGNGFPSGP